ncbi:cytochrome c biogenesis protein ResB [Propionibacteriaceae bacterium G57]|uniref:cytochrome c biogenesis protein ResB n=1 Tax=Aestuariimicrobium sp. G57 TaxID=3418485 RepID=UPI003DA74F35
MADEVERSTDAAPATPSLNTIEFLRWIWTQLTSMRTALVLLFLLALAAIPGSLIPQQPVSPIRVLDFAEANPELDKVYRALGLYDVYGSPWFAAIYLLLFVSLIGCILPRIKVYARALRTPPPKVPARLSRLPEWGRAKLPAGTSTAAALDAAEQALKAKRFRVVRSDNGNGEHGLSAERGYLRELGNLVFHLSLVFVLVGVAWNNLFSFKGTAIVVEGNGFSNVITQYDEFHAGAGVNMNSLPPFSLKLNRFHAAFEQGPVQRGAARLFNAEVTATHDGKTEDTNIEVNHPLNIDGTNVHLLGHGYAAHVTVRDGSGNIAFSGPVIFQPQDGNFTSFGVIKAPDGRPQRLAFEGWFLPTGVVDQLGPRSIFPDAGDPQLFLNAWAGPPKQETGRPENVYTLDKTGLTQLQRDGQPVAFRLKPGEAYQLPDGQGEIIFDGWSRWTQLQISRNPGLPLATGSLALGVLGLCFSLFVRPRRLWVKVVEPDDDAPDDAQPTVEVGGLDRADSRTGLAEDVTEVLSSVSPREGDKQ